MARVQRVLPDRTVFFCDAFAFTRMDAGGACKHCTDVIASPAQPLSVGGAPPRVLVGGPRRGQNQVLDLASLKPVEKFKDALTEAITPDGTGFLEGAVIRGGGVFYEHARRPCAATVDLGEESLSNASGPRLCDAALARFRVAGPLQFCDLYSLTARDPEHLLCVQVRGASGAWLSAWPSSEALTVVQWVPHAGDVVAVRVGLDGKELGRVRDRSITEPVVDGLRLVTQPEPARVRSLDPRGSSVEWDLTKIARSARARSARSEVENSGAALLIAGCGRTLAVPWHGETVLDLDPGVEFDRGLNPRSAALRAWVAAWCERHRGELRAQGVGRLAALKTTRGGEALFSRVPVPEVDLDQRERLLQRFQEELSQALALTVDDVRLID